MTREEAIKILEYTLYCADTETPKGANEEEAIPMAIEALQTDIVRCSECEHKADNYCYKHSHEVTDSDFCSYGERKE